VCHGAQLHYYIATGRRLHSKIVSVFDGYNVMLCLNGSNDHLQLLSQLHIFNVNQFFVVQEPLGTTP
jgi:hypothetical protein